jgi:small redox-active disulfide protein 2
MTTRQILGTGCPKCRLLTERAEQAAHALGLEYTLDKVPDLQAIVAFGAMATPAPIVNDVVKAAGHVPSADPLKPMLS